MFEFFGNGIVRKVEKKKKVDSEVEVLKKQQKVESDKVLKEYEATKRNYSDSVDAQIKSYEAQIIQLKAEKKGQLELYDKQLKVDLDKKINDFDRKIIAKQNQSKRLSYLIDAEQRNMQDVISPDQPNAPKDNFGKIGFQVLNEESKSSKKSK